MLQAFRVKVKLEIVVLGNLSNFMKRVSSLPFQCIHLFSCVRYFWCSTWRKLFETKSYGRCTLFGETVFLLEGSMIVSFNAKILRTFLCDELVQPDATDPSTCTYQDSPSHCSCQIRTCMSQYDSMQLMDHRLSLLKSLLQNLTPLWQGCWKSVQAVKSHEQQLIAFVECTWKKLL